MFDLMKREQLPDLHLHQDSRSGLRAIIAIHSTLRGPALGGCRFLEYADTEAAIADAARLAHGMSYKAALADIPHGGGKSVLLKPHGRFNRRAMMEAFGDFVDSLGGRYITAVDSGTSSEDMDIIATRTRYTTSTSAEGNPSAYTAQGVYRGIQAAVAHRLGRNNLQGVHVALQGLGHVGLALAQLLAQVGARLSVADMDPNRVHQCCELTGAKAVAVEDIHRIECDVFTPCALGGVVSEHSLKEFQCAVIAGSANNQLTEEALGQALLERDILYAPDYAINAGGLIYAAFHHRHASADKINQKINGIGTTLGDIFQQSRHSQVATNLIANRLAEAKLYLRPARPTPWTEAAAHNAISAPQANSNNSLH